MNRRLDGKFEEKNQNPLISELFV